MKQIIIIIVIFCVSITINAHHRSHHHDEDDDDNYHGDDNEFFEDEVKYSLMKNTEKLTVMEQEFIHVYERLDNSEEGMERKVDTLTKSLNTFVEEMEHKMSVVTDELNESNEEVAELKFQLHDLSEILAGILKTLNKPDIVGMSCKKLLSGGYNENGIYKIYAAGDILEIDCDMDAGGYMVFQKRFDGSTSFNQSFYSYVHGFGTVVREHWLGLEKLHRMTKKERYQLRIELLAYDGDTAYAEYDNFSIGEGPGYKLHLGAYSGTAGDALAPHNGQDFSTPDHDRDQYTQNCAEILQGAWWYNKCLQSNLNAFEYYTTEPAMGMIWSDFKGWRKPMKATTMMLRENL